MHPAPVDDVVRFTVTKVSVDPPVAADVRARREGGEWRLTVAPDNGETPFDLDLPCGAPLINWLAAATATAPAE